MTSVLFGIVKSNEDPDKLGRVQVELLDHGKSVVLPWLRVMQDFAGKKGGSICLPEKDEHVIVLRGSGDPSTMVVIGSLYTAKTKPLAVGGGAAGDPTVRGLITPGGTEVAVIDTKDKEAVVVQTKSAKVLVRLDGKKTTIEVTAEKEININSPKGKVNVKAKEALVDAEKATVKGSKSGVLVDGGSSKVEVKGGNVEIKGSSGVKIASGKVEIG